MRLATALLSAGALAATASVASAQPPGFEGKDVDDAGVKIHYVVRGDGPLVVMIHGFPDYWGTWKPLMRTLSADGYRTAAVDLRGYDLSDKPKGVEAYAMPLLVADIAAVVKAEGRSSAIIVGHDWGAAVAWQVAMTRPDIVDRLVILSVPHPTTFAREMAVNKEQQAGSQYARDFQKPGAEAGFTAAGLSRWVKDPAEKPGYLEAFSRSDFTSMLNYYRANYPQLSGGGTRAPAPLINVPVFVIHGLKDTALNAAGHAGTWDYVTKDTTLLMIPSAGHFVQHDAEVLVNRSIKDWLDARRTPAP
jgi:pimeloyl-ACP methyl ester carboxylesterase